MKIVLLGVLALSLRAQAVPTLYPDYVDTQMRNPTTSNYVGDSQSRSRFYVLPPNVSYAMLQSLNTVTANVGFCTEISQLQKYNLDTIALMNTMKVKDLNLRNQLAEQNAKLQIASEELATYIVKNSLQEIANVDAQIAKNDQHLGALTVEIELCKLVAPGCAEVQKDWEQSQFHQGELLLKRHELSNANLGALNDYDRRKALNESLREGLADLENNWRQVQADMKSLYSEFNSMFDAHAKREGGRVSISYDSHWSNAVAMLKSYNSQYGFERIPTKNASVKVSSYSKANLGIEGAILSFDVGGSSANGAVTFESFPESFTGTAVLNLLGTCPLLRPELFGLDRTNPLGDMKFGMTVSYEYPASMRYDITAHYNMYHMYELIKAQGTSGGFFSSSSWTSHDEQEYFKDAFSVDWKIQDEKKIFTEEQKLAINADLRRQVMSRLATRLVMNNQADKVTLATAVPATGSYVLSNSLIKVCPLNAYCQGASIVLNVLQAIFGSSDVRQTLKQTSNVESVDRYSGEQMVMQPMLTTYR